MLNFRDMFCSAFLRMSFPEILNLNHFIEKEGPVEEDSTDGASEGDYNFSKDISFLC